MAIPAKCESCGHTYNIQDRFAGEELPCKYCGDYFFVPEQSRRNARRSELNPRHEDRIEGNPQWPLALGVIGVMVVGCGLLLWSIISNKHNPPKPAQPVAATAEASSAVSTQVNAGDRFPLSSVPVPHFPQNLRPPRRHASGADIYFVDLKQTPGNDSAPGHQMAMRVYVPGGQYAPKSLGCVLVAPAGTNLLYGNAMDADDYHAETLPYVNAGYAVVFYSIDGILDDPQTASDFEFSRAYKEFKAAYAGVVNGRNALEFVLAKLPQVDPGRIYCAGHSSAGVLSLLLAEHEPRIKGCMAYAAASDVELRLGSIANNPQYETLLPDLKRFVKQSSPKTHTQHLDCPVFLFHALDDSNEPAQTSANLAAKLRSEGKTVIYQTSPVGDHYDSMVETGIPAAIQWLKTLPTETGKSFSPANSSQANNLPSQGMPRPGSQFDPPISPPSMPLRPGQRIVVFDLESYSGQGDATLAARHVLFRFPFCDPNTVQVDLAGKKLTVGLRGFSVNSGPLKTALEEVGFRLGGVTITTHTR